MRRILRRHNGRVAMSDLGTVASVEGWVGAEVPVDDCGIAATVEGAPPGVAVPDVVTGVCCCWSAARVGGFVTSEAACAAAGWRSRWRPRLR